MSRLPECSWSAAIEEAAGAAIFALPDAAAMARAPALFELIESIQSGQLGDLELTDWGVSHTTLEDVFVSLARGGDMHHKGRQQRRDLFKATLHKASNTEIFYRAIEFYMKEKPMMLNDLCADLAAAIEAAAAAS